MVDINSSAGRGFERSGRADVNFIANLSVRK